MVRKGIVEEQIEAIGKILEHILGLKNRGDNQGALQQTQNAMKQFSGLETRTILALPEAALIPLFQRGASFDTGKAIVIATLLQEEAEIRRQRGDDPALIRRFQEQAWVLLTEVLMRAPSLRATDYQCMTEKLWQSLTAAGPTDSLAARQERFQSAIAETTFSPDSSL